MWLGQFNSKPSRVHFLAAKHVLQYLAGTRTLALRLGSPSPLLPATMAVFMQNVGCSDADWASDASDRKSISSYSFYFEGSLVSWSAVKQKSIALSSTEAEYYAMTHAFKEALWLQVFLGFLHFPSQTLPQSQLVLNISTYGITSFVLMFRTVHFLLFGYLPLICRLMFSPNHLLRPFLHDIETPLAFLFLYNKSFIFLFILFYFIPFSSISPT